MEYFSFVYCSDEEYDDLIAEISFQGEFLALLSQENGYEKIDIQLYSRKDNMPWKFKLKDLQNAIEEATKRLWELRKEVRT